MGKNEIAAILAAHKKWIHTDHAEGYCADFRGADLRGAMFFCAVLNRADLTGAKGYNR